MTDMENRYRIILYRSGNDIPANFAEFLLAHKHSVQEVFDTEELLDLVQKTVCPVLVCSDPGIPTERRLLLQFLLNLGSSLDLPLLWVGEVSSDFEIALGGCFPGFVRLKKFENNQKAMSVIDDLINSLGSRAKDFHFFVDVRESEAAPPPHSPSEAVVIPSVSSKDHFFHTDHLFAPITFEALQYAKLLPPDAKLQMELKAALEDFRRLDQMHILRTGYMGMQLAQSIPLGIDLQEAAQAASLLYASDFPRTSSSQALVGAISFSGTENDKAIGERYIKSAKNVLQSLSREHVADVIQAAGELLLSQEKPRNEMLHLAASSLLVSDMSNRNAFQRGQFSGGGAKSFLEKVRKGRLDVLHPLALEYGTHFLVQALAQKQGRSPGALAPGLLPTDLANARQVGLAELKPGMRLIQPIIANGGKILLSKDTCLDKDLILRIWQMASVMRLSLPCFVDARSVEKG